MANKRTWIEQVQRDAEVATLRRLEDAKRDKEPEVKAEPVKEPVAEVKKPEVKK